MTSMLRCTRHSFVSRLVEGFINYVPMYTFDNFKLGTYHAMKLCRLCY